jgi:catalase
MVSHLLNVDKSLAAAVAKGLGLSALPRPAEAANPPRTDLKASPLLSISLNGPKTFTGRKIGALISDGVDAELITALRNALDQEGALLELVAPVIGGVKANDGSLIEAHQAIAGGPSVLYDAVAILISDDAADQLITNPAARDFVSDAFAHAKFVGYTASALPMLKGVLGDGDLDGGFFEVETAASVTDFVKACRSLRFWERKASGPKHD